MGSVFQDILPRNTNSVLPPFVVEKGIPNIVCITISLIFSLIAEIAHSADDPPFVKVGNKIERNRCGCILEVHNTYPPKNPFIVSVDTFNDKTGVFSGKFTHRGDFGIIDTGTGDVNGTVTITRNPKFGPVDPSEITKIEMNLIQMNTIFGGLRVFNYTGFQSLGTPDEKFTGVFIAGNFSMTDSVSPPPGQIDGPEVRNIVGPDPFFGISVKP